jgi:hypothetical protein
MLGMHTPLEEQIGCAQIALGKDVIAGNIKKEKALSKRDKKGQSLLCVSIDGAWNNRGSAKPTILPLVSTSLWVTGVVS